MCVENLQRCCAAAACLSFAARGWLCGGGGGDDDSVVRLRKRVHFIYKYFTFRHKQLCIEYIYIIEREISGFFFI